MNDIFTGSLIVISVEIAMIGCCYKKGIPLFLDIRWEIKCQIKVYGNKTGIVFNPLHIAIGPIDRIGYPTKHIGYFGNTVRNRIPCKVALSDL